MSGNAMTSKNNHSIFREKYDLLINNILNKQISIDRVIENLKKNRRRLFLSEPVPNTVGSSQSPDILTVIIDSLNVNFRKKFQLLAFRPDRTVSYPPRFYRRASDSQTILEADK